jgi:electron transport complex protein RnfG
MKADANDVDNTPSAPASPPPSVPRVALRSAAILALYALVFTALMAFAHQITLPRILASIQEGRMRLIDEVLPRPMYDNILLDDAVTVSGTPVTQVWRARQQGRPVALVFETVAPDGYGGRIELVAALGSDGTLNGVRVTAHHETPGLGDYIDPRKDHDKARPWITRVSGMKAASSPPEQWAVRKDGGDIDYHTGATVSARAVTRATGAAVKWIAAHADALFNAPAGTRFDAEGKVSP